ncbi:MAG: hypothetical protein KA436_02400 [Oligoflexales bacterium]|nr:hypothetical protein [Oligoflexales bacterium]
MPKVFATMTVLTNKKYESHKMTKQLLFIIFSSFFIKNCGASPDLVEAPGLCKLSCSDPKIAGSDMSIRFDSTEITVNCFGIASGQEYGPIPVRFVVESEQKTLPAESVPGDVTGGTATGGATAAEGVPKKVPIGAVSFEAVVISGQMGAENPSDDRSKYKGIATPMEEWCTDSCGVGNIDLVPLCLGEDANPVSLLIRSGSLSKELKVTVAGKKAAVTP